PTAGSSLLPTFLFCRGRLSLTRCVRVFKGNGGEVMTTIADFDRGNFNGDIPPLGGDQFGSVGDLVLFDNFGDKAIWLEDGSGGRLATSPTGFNLPFTGPTWHIAAAADFDSVNTAPSAGGNNPTAAADLLWVNDNGDLAIWQSTGDNVNPFSGSNQANLPNPGAGWHVKAANDFDGDQPPLSGPGGMLV